MWGGCRCGEDLGVGGCVCVGGCRCGGDVGVWGDVGVGGM